MSNFLNRLSGYNKNNVKMNVLGSNTANNGDVIQVDLPTNSIVVLSSLAWSFKNTWSVAVVGNDQNQQEDRGDLGSSLNPKKGDMKSFIEAQRRLYA